jgi:hypothetical protein
MHASDYVQRIRIRCSLQEAQEAEASMSTPQISDEDRRNNVRSKWVPSSYLSVPLQD